MSKKLSITSQRLIRVVLIILLVGINIYWFWPKEDDSLFDFRFYLMLFGVGCGYLVYRLAKAFLIKDNEDEDFDVRKRKQIFAIVAGCIIAIPFFILSFTKMGSVFGWIVVVIVIDIIALYFILTSDFDKI